MPERFPILKPDKTVGPSTIPWEWIEPHREQAMTNHYQTIERLAERGGLTWPELVCVITGHKWTDLCRGDPKQKLEK